jgi:uncharacterized iron-regulated membrane protein
MKLPSRVLLRRALKWMHTWVGLVTGLVIAVISVTGSVIVFRSEIENASAPRSESSTRIVMLDELSRQVAQANPGARIRRVRFPAQPGDPMLVQAEISGETRRLICDASTGRVTGVLKSGWVDWTIDLHRNLLAGKTGRKAVGVAGIILLTLAATGMTLWLIGARRWRSWVSVGSQGSSRRFNFELHRVTGLWSYALLTVLAFTGIGLAYPDTFRSALRSMTASPLPEKAPRVKNAPGSLRPLDEYLSAGKLAMPDGVVTEMRLPENDKAPVDLRCRRPGDLASAGNHVYMDPPTGRVIGVVILASQPLATRIFSTFAPIHYGEFGGVPIQVLWGLVGLMPSVLFVTGLITWWRPSRSSKQPIAKDERELAASIR